jgi:hypothetical protein
MHHCTIQINHQPHATIFQFIILTFIYNSTYFGRFPAHHQKINDRSGSLWFYLRIVVTVVLCSWTGQPARPVSPPKNKFLATILRCQRLLNIEGAKLKILRQILKSLKKGDFGLDVASCAYLLRKYT